MEEQTNAHTRLQRCCPAGKCYWSQKTPFPLEGNHQDPAGSAGHAGHYPQGVPGTASQHRRPPAGSPLGCWWPVPGWLPTRHSFTPGLAPGSLHRQPPAQDPRGSSPPPGGTSCPRSSFAAARLQKHSRTPEPPFPPCISSGDGSKGCSPRAEANFFFSFCWKTPHKGSRGPVTALAGGTSPPGSPPPSPALPAACGRAEPSHLARRWALPPAAGSFGIPSGGEAQAEDNGACGGIVRAPRPASKVFHPNIRRAALKITVISRPSLRPPGRVRPSLHGCGQCC